MMNRNGIFDKTICTGVCGVIMCVLATLSSASAAVVSRPTQTATRVSASRPSAAAARMPTMTVNTTASTSVSATAEPETVETPEPVEPAISVENKSSQFGTNLSAQSATETDIAAATLAEMVRTQRAALDSADAAAAVASAAMDMAGTGESSCDTALRECMIARCGNNFAKCANDTDTAFGDKLDTCRRSTNCTGREYQLFAPEILADRDMNIKLSLYNSTVDCGNSYDNCIVSACGANYSKCIGKSAGDTAIAKCDSIAKSCTGYDSGLAMRAMGVFGELRQGAERQIATDEQKLYALREQMRSLCSRLGAMFDERSLDCVYTVNFYAGDDGTLFASKKSYAGGTFDCTPNWFGVDITTYRENAYRETRAQTSASSAMLGSGLGIAAGAVSSGAIDRAIARFNADNAVERAKQECIETYGADAPECQSSGNAEPKPEQPKAPEQGQEQNDVNKQVVDWLINGDSNDHDEGAISATQDGSKANPADAGNDPDSQTPIEKLKADPVTYLKTKNIDVSNTAKDKIINFINKSQQNYNVVLSEIDNRPVGALLYSISLHFPEFQESTDELRTFCEDTLDKSICSDENCDITTFSLSGVQHGCKLIIRKTE